MWVVVGTNNLYEKNETAYKVDYFERHPKHNLDYHFFDIALVHVSKPIEFTEKVNKIPLQTELFNEVNVTAVMTGWGFTKVRKIHNY